MFGLKLYETSKSKNKKNKNNLSDGENLTEKYYDQNNNLIKELHYDIEGFYKEYIFEYDLNNNQIKEQTTDKYEDTEILEKKYDLEGRIIKYKFLGSNKKWIKFLEYSPDGKLLKSTFVDDISSVNNSVEKEYYQYDSNGNEKYCYTIWKTDNKVVLRFIEKKDYDLKGNCIMQSMYFGEDYPDWSKDKELKELIFKISDDEKSSIEPECFKTEIINGEPFLPRRKITFNYDKNGNMISSVTDEINWRNFHEYNDRNLKVKSTHLGEIGWKITNYEYDEKDRLIKKILIKGDDDNQKEKDYIENCDHISFTLIDYYNYKKI